MCKKFEEMTREEAFSLAGEFFCPTTRETIAHGPDAMHARAAAAAKIVSFGIVLSDLREGLDTAWRALPDAPSLSCNGDEGQRMRRLIAKETGIAATILKAAWGIKEDE